MKKTQKPRKKNGRKQVVKISLVKLFMKKRTINQALPEDHFWRTLNLTK
jgi:hypothetical protein